MSRADVKCHKQAFNDDQFIRNLFEFYFNV